MGRNYTRNLGPNGWELGQLPGQIARFNLDQTALLSKEGAYPVAGRNNVQMLRRVCDWYDNQDSTAYVGAVSGASTSALNTTIGSSGRTAYGRRAWRLTTEALNGSYAEVTIKQSFTGYLKNLAHIDVGAPLVILIAPHATNGGSRLKVWFAANDATDAGNTSVRGDMYINGLNISGEQQTVVALYFDMRSIETTSSKLAELTAVLNKLRIQAFQEGTSGITDITILGVYQAIERPMLHIGFDDGLKSVYDNAWPIMRDRDLLGSVAVMGANVGLTSANRQAYLNLPLMVKTELDELVAAGWEMTVHGTSGPSSLTYAQALSLLQGQKTAVEALGYTQSSDFYVYPGGVGNWTADSDGEPIGPKALRDAGFKHARLLYGGGKFFSYAFNGLGIEPLMQDSLAINMYRGPGTTIYETADYAAQIKSFELQLEKLSAGMGFLEVLTHNVVARSFFPSGQPYSGDGYTGTVSVTNDTSTETFEAMMDLVAYYRDLGLIEVVLKRDWYAGIPATMEKRRTMMRLWQR